MTDKDGRVIGPDHQLNAPPKSGKSWIVWTIVILVLVAGAWSYLCCTIVRLTKGKTGFGGSGAGGGRRGMTGPVPVTVATATKGSIGVYIDAIGTVTPVYTNNYHPAGQRRYHRRELPRGPIRPQRRFAH